MCAAVLFENHTSVATRGRQLNILSACYRLQQRVPHRIPEANEAVDAADRRQLS